MNRKQFLQALLLGAGALALPWGAQAQGAWPEKPITAIVPFPPGGSTDQIARAIGPRMTQKLNQPWVVENRPGATGAIGATQVKRAAPDGYTLMVASIGVYAVNPLLQKGLQYDPLRDFDLLTVAVRAPNVLVATPGLPVHDVNELVAYLKKNPGKTSFANSGSGSSDHLTAALFLQKTGTSATHVPYKGGAPAMTDLLGGHADASFQNLNVVVNHIKSGKLKALAITGDKRSPLLPQVPTLAEAGIAGVDVYSWQGIAAPKGLPRDVKDKLVSALATSLNDPEVKGRLQEQGFEVVANTPEQFTRFAAQELERWRQVVQTGKIEAN
jgi:tripartite-type tricarboxylate transporter receptor subunit TctC